MSFSPYLFIDLVILLIIALFCWHGATKGLLLSLLSMLALGVSLVGALFIAGTFAPTVSEFVSPVIETLITDQVYVSLESYGVTEDSSLLDAIPLESLDDYLRTSDQPEIFRDALDELMEAHEALSATEIIAGVSAFIALLLSEIVLFILSFLLISVVWLVLSHGLNLVTKLPIIHGINALGGGLLGLATALFLLFICAWAVGTLGNLIPGEIAEETYLFRFFLTVNPLDFAIRP